MEIGTWNDQTGVAPSDGQAHRWVFYATIRKDGDLLARSARVYFKSAALPAALATTPH